LPCNRRDPVAKTTLRLAHQLEESRKIKAHYLSTSAMMKLITMKTDIASARAYECFLQASILEVNDLSIQITRRTAGMPKDLVVSP
jgi:hypothetical protein